MGALEILSKTHQHNVALINRRQQIDNVMTTSMYISTIDQEMDLRWPLLTETPIKMLLPVFTEHVESMK